MTAKHSASEQREALEWLLNLTVEPLKSLARRGELDQADLDRHLPAAQQAIKTLQFIELPWVQEAIKGGYRSD